MIKGLIALAFGALCFGVMEFVAMGLLPYFASDFNVDIAVSGHTISVYALGVCVGVIYLMVSRKVNLKTSILFVVIVQFIGIVMTAFASSFEMLMVARFISGMPHGCFFGLATIISTRIAKAGKSSSAMAIMLAGQTISNVFGVPLGTALANAFSWRAIFYIMIVWSILVIVSIWRFLPDPGKLEDHGFMKQFDFLKRKAPYLIGISILVGNGGIFCLQSYVSPVLTDFVGIALAQVSVVLIAMGIAMTVANLISGRICDKVLAGTVSTCIFIITIAAMAGTFFLGDITVVGVILMVVIAGMLFGLSTPQQVSILRASRGGELIGVAFGQVAFNFGNAIGAFLGGIPLEMGMGARYVIMVAMILTTIGTVAIYFYGRYHERALIEEAKAADEAAKAALAAQEQNASQAQKSAQVA